MTNPFGNYQFTEVAAGQSYVISVSAKRWSFDPQFVSPTEGVTIVNFTAME
jgi:hypothetical protein